MPAFAKNRPYRLIFAAAILIFVIIVLTARSVPFRSVSNRPNIILITIDALRADYLSCYGYKKEISPAIDLLVGEGVMFSQMVAQASWTPPAMYSITTSTYPSTHGMLWLDRALSNKLLTLPQLLKRKNVATALISGHGGLSRTGGFERGFDTYYDKFQNAEIITAKSMDWVAENKSNKFFLWVHYMDAHNSALGIPEEKHDVKNVTKKEKEKYTLDYEEAISHIDTQIANLLKKLKELNIYENTVIMLTADHGQEIGEHGVMMNHGGFLWEPLLKIPLVIAYPKLPFSKNIFTQQAQQIDIAPTICKLLGVKKPPSFEGRDLLNLIKKSGAQSIGVYSEHAENERDLSSNEWRYSVVSLRLPPWKLFYISGPDNRNEYSLYNIENDPLEHINLIDSHKERFDFLRKRLYKFHHRIREEALYSSRHQLEDGTEERLRSLGYLQ